MGSRTRLLRFAPGVYTTAPFVHDHWEEVYLLSGDLVVGNDDKGKGGEPFEAPTYACRPPGVHHGPFKSERGCMLYEIHYYDEGRKYASVSVGKARLHRQDAAGKISRGRFARRWSGAIAGDFAHPTDADGDAGANKARSAILSRRARGFRVGQTDAAAIPRTLA